MKKKLVIFIICIAIILVGIFYCLIKNGVILSKENDAISSETNDVILYKSSYNYPIAETIQILSNGDIEKCSVLTELTINGAPEAKFEKIGKLSNSELNDLISMLNQLQKQELKTENFSQSYGIAIKYNDEKYLYDAQYFEQKSVDELDNFVQNILKRLN